MPKRAGQAEGDPTGAVGPEQNAEMGGYGFPPNPAHNDAEKAYWLTGIWKRVTHRREAEQTNAERPCRTGTYALGLAYTGVGGGPVHV